MNNLEKRWLEAGRPSFAIWLESECYGLEAENERLRAALQEQWQRAHDSCPDDYVAKEDCTSNGCVKARQIVLARGEEASSG